MPPKKQTGLRFFFNFLFTSNNTGVYRRKRRRSAFQTQEWSSRSNKQVWGSVAVVVVIVTSTSTMKVIIGYNIHCVIRVGLKHTFGMPSACTCRLQQPCFRCKQTLNPFLIAVPMGPSYCLPQVLHYPPPLPPPSSISYIKDWFSYIFMLMSLVSCYFPKILLRISFAS